MNLIIQKNSVIFLILIILFPVLNLFGGGILDYYDEVLGLISSIEIIFWMVEGRVNNDDRKIVLILIFITLIGIASNVFCVAVKNLFAISVDILWLWKPFACYIFFKTIVSEQNQREGILIPLVSLSKYTIIFVCMCSILGQYIDIGVTGSSLIMGIKTFGFFWRNGIQTGWLLFCCLCIIATDEEQNFKLYLILALIPALLTSSSLVYCWFFIVIALLFLLKEDQKIKVWKIVCLALGVIAFTFADVSSYLLSESVRSAFWKAAISLANQYFPFGTGFASFGSDMAARYYSPIYISLGWENTWALGRNGDYLNDNFFASIIGQFGWIGFILYLLCLTIMFKSVNTNNLNKNEKVTGIATVLTIAAVMIGSASAKSMMGVCTFSVLGIIAAKNNLEKSDAE